MKYETVLNAIRYVKLCLIILEVKKKSNVGRIILVCVSMEKQPEKKKGKCQVKKKRYRQKVINRSDQRRENNEKEKKLKQMN